MEIVDELNTPGCPQCAIKHLSAAIAYAANDRRGGLVSNGGVAYARAMINLAEVLTGYRSHLWYAVGLLVKCEERFAAVEEPENPQPGTDTLRCYRLKKLAREARLLLEQHPESVAEAYGILDAGVVFPGEMAMAHASEAQRELPAKANRIFGLWTTGYYGPEILGVIDEIHREFFELPPSTVPGEETQTKEEKEPTMATAKKTATAKKAGCKGGKCCDKGGKAKKACDKGGKAKK